MITLGICLSVGILFAAGTYLFMHRNAIRAIIGLMLLSNAVNLAVLAVSNSPSGKRPPIVEKYSAKQTVALGEVVPESETEIYDDIWAGKKSVDPLPQALILTAIVIGFGVMAFMIALVYCTHAEQDTVLLYRLEDAETPDAAEKKKKATPKTPPDPSTATGAGLQFLPFAVSDGFMEVEDSSVPTSSESRENTISDESDDTQQGEEQSSKEKGKGKEERADS